MREIEKRYETHKDHWFSVLAKVEVTEAYLHWTPHLWGLVDGLLADIAVGTPGRCDSLRGFYCTTESKQFSAFGRIENTIKTNQCSFFWKHRAQHLQNLFLSEFRTKWILPMENKWGCSECIDSTIDAHQVQQVLQRMKTWIFVDPGHEGHFLDHVWTVVGT